MLLPPVPQKIQTLEISSGEKGIDQTVGYMMELIRRGAAWPPLRPIALRIIEGCADRDFDCMVWKIFQFVKINTKFVNDNFGVETLQSVPYMIAQMDTGRAYGDCDDFTVLLGALLKVIGIPVKIRVLKFIGSDNFTHVLPVANIRGRGWCELDATIAHGEMTGAVKKAEKDYPVIR